jgi:hypothetical protein
LLKSKEQSPRTYRLSQLPQAHAHNQKNAPVYWRHGLHFITSFYYKISLFGKDKGEVPAV